MYIINLLSFLVFALPSCFAGEDRGNVLDFAPAGDFRYIFSKHEKSVDLFDKWLENDKKKFIQISCKEIQLNANTENVISQFRTNILTVDNVELESFKVTECNENKLLNSIQISLTREEDHKRGYVIVFKDIENKCRTRTYQVDVTPNKVDSIVAITRSTVGEIKYGFRSKCPIPKEIEGLAFEWYDDGKYYDYDLFEKYALTVKLGGLKCEGCWILCKETTKYEIERKGNTKDNDKESKAQKPTPQDQKVFYVDLLVQSTPVDRIKVASCTGFSLKSSIQFDFSVQADNRYRSFYINYLKPDGICYYRNYNIDVQYHPDILLKRVFVKREEESINRDCKTMKARGMARSAAKKVARHFGRITNRSISLQKQDEDEEAK